MLRQFMTLVALTLVPALSVAAQKGVKKCRMPGASYDLETARLPTCAVKAAPTRQPASVAETQPATLNFSSYLNANAAHPALARRKPLPQEAFKDWSKPAVITGSSADVDKAFSPDSGEARAPAAAPTAAPAVPGAAPTPPAPDNR
jgi:hypothetical protein